MTNSKMTKRALLTSVMALVLCFAMLTGTTFAWFTDQETSANNRIVAGNLDVDLLMYNGTKYVSIANGNGDIFKAGTTANNSNATLWEPGKTQIAYLAIENKGNLDLKYKVELNVKDPKNGKLYEVMTYTITPDAKNGDLPAWDATKAIDVKLGKQDVSEEVKLGNGATHYFALSIHMSENAGNDYMNDYVIFDLTVYATQLDSESDAFDNQYDADAFFDLSKDENGAYLLGSVTDLLAFNAAANEPGTLGNEGARVEVKLTADIDMAGRIWTPIEDMWITIDGNGHTIKNLTTSNSRKAGLFGYAGAVTIKNLTIENANVTGSQAGIFAGNGEGLTIENCFIKGQNTVTFIETKETWNGIGALTGVLQSSTVNVTIVEGTTVTLNKGAMTTASGCVYIDNITGYISANNGTVVNNGTINVIEQISDGLSMDTKGNYYVFNAEGLAAMNTMMAEKTAGRDAVVNIMADIDFAGKTWKTVDSHADTAFEIEEINGNGYTISNFKIDGQAMFSRFAGLGDVVIKDITFDNATVNSASLNSAILTGHSYQNVLLDNVDVKNSTITGAYKVAPLIATVYNENSTTVTATLKNCDVSNTTVTSTQYDFMATGFVAFVNEGNNDKVVFENCTLTDTVIKGEDKTYKACAFVYCDGSPEGCYNDVEGVTVTNSYAIYKSNHSNVYTDAAGNMYVFDIYGLLSLNTYFKNNSMNNATWGKTYNIMADIDADECVWNCVYMNTGDNNNNGIVIDGHGHTISNLYIDGGAMLGGTPCGGNSNATPGYVRDLTFDNVHVKGEHFASVVWGGSAIAGNVVYDNVHVINSDITANCNVGAFVAATGEFNNSVTVKFKNCSVKNTTLTANGKDGQDPTGANAFIGRAHADTKVIFEGDNTVENNTFVNGNGLVGGGIYGYTIWDSTVEGNWRGTGCSNSFTNWDGIK